MKIFFAFLPVFFVLINFARSQSSAGEDAPFETRYIVEMPTAGVVHKGGISASCITFSQGGVMAELYAAPFESFNMGLSFSGINVIGSGEIKSQNIPGIHLRYRIFDEKIYMPAILIGASTQGRGEFSVSGKRFHTMSPGLYLVASKNYSWLLGSVAYHGGINYSFEPRPEERSPNFYLGLEHSVGAGASINLEYNANLDDRDEFYREKQGLLNAALRWSLIKGITLELQLRDILDNQNNMDGAARSISIEYIGTI